MKRRPELVPLSDDHHSALMLARRADRAASSGDAAAVADAWGGVARGYAADLAPHFAIEEDCLLPSVRRAQGEALAARMADDHRALRAMALQGPRDAPTLAAFAERLRAHVRFEERELFPFCEARLSDSELEQVAAASAARR